MYGDISKNQEDLRRQTIKHMAIRKAWFGEETGGASYRRTMCRGYTPAGTVA